MSDGRVAWKKISARVF